MTDEYSKAFFVSFLVPQISLPHMPRTDRPLNHNLAKVTGLYAFLASAMGGCSLVSLLVVCRKLFVVFLFVGAGGGCFFVFWFSSIEKG